MPAAESTAERTSLAALCGATLAPLTMHILLNAAMFGLLFGGYQ
jgi:hypothetical protein